MVTLAQRGIVPGNPAWVSLGNNPVQILVGRTTNESDNGLLSLSLSLSWVIVIGFGIDHVSESDGRHGKYAEAYYGYPRHQTYYPGDGEAYQQWYRPYPTPPSYEPRPSSTLPTFSVLS